MKKIITAILICITILTLSVFASCMGPQGNAPYIAFDENAHFFLFGESYNSIIENSFFQASQIRDSYFSMDSFTASYSNLRRYVENGYRLNGDVIKTDELINYFDYDYPKPTDETFNISAEMAATPWNETHKLITLAVTTKEASAQNYKGNNYVFLIDVSGSMAMENKLPLVKKAFNILLDELDDDDTVSIVTYANGTRVVCDGVKASRKERLSRKINGLGANGGTAGGEGLNKAYSVAEKHFIKGGNNRVIIASDGDFNVGPSNADDLEDLITEKRESGIYLTCLGFGMGNYRDTTMETLAKNGNGGYAYIDDEKEAEKVFVHDLTKTMFTVAKDVKSKVTFNPDVVDQYRLIGYENKLLTREEFEDENADAGEIGSGHTSVVCYEVVLKNDANTTENAFEVSINYKDPTTDESQNKTAGFTTATLDKPVSENHQFVSAIVEFGLLLRQSPYAYNANYRETIARLESLSCTVNDEIKSEFLDLVKTAKEKQIVADPLYERYRVIVFYTGFDVRYVLVEKDTEITPDFLISHFFAYALTDSEYEIEFFTDSDLSEPLTSFTLENSVNLYLKMNKYVIEVWE